MTKSNMDLFEPLLEVKKIMFAYSSKNWSRTNREHPNLNSKYSMNKIKFPMYSYSNAQASSILNIQGSYSKKACYYL